MARVFLLAESAPVIVRGVAECYIPSLRISDNRLGRKPGYVSLFLSHTPRGKDNNGLQDSISLSQVQIDRDVERQGRQACSKRRGFLSNAGLHQPGRIHLGAEVMAEKTVYLVGANTEGCKKLGAAIKACRLSNELAPIALAEMVGIHVSFVRGIERGIQSPSMETAKKIFDALPCEHVDVIWKDDPLVDLIFKQNEVELCFKFSAEVRGQNNRGDHQVRFSRLLYVAMRMPIYDGSGAPKLLGVYDDRRFAEARCFRDLNSKQPATVFDCILNEDFEEED